MPQPPRDKAPSCQRDSKRKRDPECGSKFRSADNAPGLKDSIRRQPPKRHKVKKFGTNQTQQPPQQASSAKPLISQQPQQQQVEEQLQQPQPQQQQKQSQQQKLLHQNLPNPSCNLGKRQRAPDANSGDPNIGYTTRRKSSRPARKQSHISSTEGEPTHGPEGPDTQAADAKVGQIHNSTPQLDTPQQQPPLQPANQCTPPAPTAAAPKRRGRPRSKKAAAASKASPELQEIGNEAKQPAAQPRCPEGLDPGSDHGHRQVAGQPKQEGQEAARHRQGRAGFKKAQAPQAAQAVESRGRGKQAAAWEGPKSSEACGRGVTSSGRRSQGKYCVASRDVVVMFANSVQDDDKQSFVRIVERLGGRVAADNELDFTVYTGVQDTPFVASFNSLYALASGSPILTVDWLLACKQANHFVNFESYFMRGHRQEKKFDMKLAYDKAYQQRLFQPAVQPGAMKVIITDPLLQQEAKQSTRQGRAAARTKKDEMLLLVQAAGGCVLDAAGGGSASPEDSIIIGRGPEDRAWCQSRIKVKGIPLFTKSSFVEGILQQSLPHSARALDT